MLRRFFGTLLTLAALGNGACVSGLSDLNRRPFADKVGLIAFNSEKAAGAKSIGPVEKEVCHKKWLGFFGSEPKFADVKKELMKSAKVVYITNVTSIEYASTGFLGPKYCLALKGEGFR